MLGQKTRWQLLQRNRLQDNSAQLQVGGQEPGGEFLQGFNEEKQKLQSGVLHQEIVWQLDQQGVFRLNPTIFGVRDCEPESLPVRIGGHP